MTSIHLLLLSSSMTLFFMTLSLILLSSEIQPCNGTTTTSYQNIHSSSSNDVSEGHPDDSNPSTPMDIKNGIHRYHHQPKLRLQHHRRRQLKNEKSSSKCPNNYKLQVPLFISPKEVLKYTNDTTKANRRNYPKKKIFVNEGGKTFQTKHLYEPCQFNNSTYRNTNDRPPLFQYTNDNNNNNNNNADKNTTIIMSSKYKQYHGPIPVIFICNGRSGSSNTWETLSTLAGGSKSIALETLGADTKDLQYLITQHLHSSSEQGSWHIQEQLCELSHFFCHSSIVGIQWKPYGDSIMSDVGRGIFQTISNYIVDIKTNLKFKVVWMTRNPIDVMISHMKHKLYGKEIQGGHCKVHDVKCIQKHTSNHTSVTKVPVNDLLEYIQWYENVNQQIQHRLKDEFQIEYYHTTYEKLYNSKKNDNDDDEVVAQEWMNVFNYLGRGPVHGLTMDIVEQAFHDARTSFMSRKDKLENYDEIKHALKGTDFLHYLYE